LDAILECFGCDSRAGKFIIAQQIWNLFRFACRNYE